MADLRLRVGPVTATVSASDANATRILQAMLKRTGHDVATMTGQQQANAVMAELVEFINQQAITQEILAAEQTARQGVINAPPQFKD